MKPENAIEFLLYSYFNLKLEDGDNKDRVLEASIERAYLDATQQGAYNTLLKTDSMREKSKEAKKVGLDQIKKAIGKLLLENDDNNFNTWHGNICDDLQGTYEKVCDDEGKKAFTYGNAQKWVNMSLKYLCILNAIYEKYVSECEFCKDYGVYIKKYEKEFHVPVDSYIMKVVYGERGKRKDEYKAVELPERKEKEGKKYSGLDKYAPWSTWERKDYEKFQETLRDSKVLGDSPLDWENEEWINGKEKKS